jgi:hypothetical protein
LRILWIGGVAVLLAGGGALVLWAQQDPLRAEYPDPPFPPIPPGFPSVLSHNSEPPPKAPQAYAEYQKKQKALRDYLFDKGIFSTTTAEEQQAYLAVARGQYVRGRELLRSVLKAKPDSVLARFGLAVAEEEGEGNFPRALLQIRSLRRWLYRRGLENPNDEITRDWFCMVLDREGTILREAGRSEEELRAQDVLEQLYRPRPWTRVWPLIRLRRFDEAREACRQAEALGQRPDELMNYRILIARKEGRRKEQYDVALQAVAARPGHCFAWKSLAEAALDDFRFQEAYDAAVKAAGLRVNYRGSPYQVLCASFLDQGRIAEAWDALKKFQEQRRLREPYTLQFDQDELDATAARLLLELGQCHSALRFARRRVENPRRLGFAMTDSRIVAFSADLLLLEAICNRLEELHEGAAEPQTAAEAATLRLQRWALEKRVARALGDEEFLLERLRPPRADAILPLLPGRVAAEALRRAREKESHPSAAPYFDALEAELAYGQGRYEEALTRARAALQGLSAEFEKRLRAQVAALAGEAARKLGQTDQMLSLFDQALRDGPAVFRMYRIAIPISVTDDGSPLAQSLGKRILASPRFRQDAAGFPVTLRTTGQQLTFELCRLRQVRHCADSVTVEAAPTEAVAAAHRRFHERLLSPLLDLKPIDVNSLEDCLFAAPPGDRLDATIRLLSAR